MFNVTRKFGVEIELLVPTAYLVQFNPGSYHRGLQIEGAPRGWNCQADSSVQSDLIGYTGVEIVSPVLQGEDGLVELLAVLDYLQEIGCQYNGKCGLHVHADARDVDGPTMLNIRTAFTAFEQAFYSLSGFRGIERMTNPYCLPSGQWNGTRYQSLNWTNWERYGHKKTVECRVWAASLDPAVVLGAVLTFVGLVDKVVAEGLPKVLPPRHLPWMHGYTSALVGYLGLDQDSEVRDEILPTLFREAVKADQQAGRVADPEVGPATARILSLHGIGTAPAQA